MPVLNDVHSRLNATCVAEIVRPRTGDDVIAAIGRARREGRHISIAGGRHAMGGQQFAADALHLDMTAMNDTIAFDTAHGLITLGAGADWTRIVAATHDAPPDSPCWSIRQKQTGADSLTLGGSLAANIHGRGLLLPPIIGDVESFRLVTASGELLRCSRRENADWFSLVIGGYGLFGVVTEVTLRLAPRTPLRRLVDIIDIDEAMDAVHRRIADGCTYGDFQYAIDPRDDSFLRRGVMACYAPAGGAVVDDEKADLPREAWLELLSLAHTDKPRAFTEYCVHYLRTHGRFYWSDTMQLSTYIPSYAEFLAARLGGSAGDTPDESLVIGELVVPPDRLIDFLASSRRVLRETGVEDIYGTIRAIRRDTESFLPWATSDFACIIFNLRTPHTPQGVARSAHAFRALIDAAADLGGSFFLTYHRWATAEQALRCHPRFVEFLKAKRERDPTGVFRSEWFTHYQRLFDLA